MVEDYRADLEAGNHVANALVLEPNKKCLWIGPYLGHDYTDVWDTTFDIDRLKNLAKMNSFLKAL
jgi:2-oxoglutarate dehydrogenase E1 component